MGMIFLIRSSSHSNRGPSNTSTRRAVFPCWSKDQITTKKMWLVWYSQNSSFIRWHLCVPVLLLTCFLWLWRSVSMNTLDFLNQALFIIPRMTWSFLFRHSQRPHPLFHFVHWLCSECMWFVYTVSLCIVSLVQSSKTQPSLFPTLSS